MWFGIVSLFPEMMDAVRGHGVTGQAVRKELIHIQCWNPRDFALDRHRSVDDRPYGGGPGMLMKVGPTQAALMAGKAVASACLKPGQNVKTIYLSPQGRRLNQEVVEALACESHLLMLAGRYKGVDERLIEAEIDEEWSVGDYVLSGGELPAMLLIDAIARLITGVLGHKDSIAQDSFSCGLLDGPHYTRPDVLMRRCVPDVLLSGDHQRIRRWKLKQSLGRTWQRRPDLLRKKILSHEEHLLLEEFIDDYNISRYKNV